MNKYCQGRIAFERHEIHQKVTHKKAVHYQRNVVAHEHGGNKFGRSLGYFLKDPGEEIVLLFFNLDVDLVGRNVRDLHPGKKCRKDKGNSDDDELGFQ